MYIIIRISLQLKLNLLNTPYDPNGSTTQFVAPSQRDGKYSKDAPHGLFINIDLGKYIMIIERDRILFVRPIFNLMLSNLIVSI